MKELLHKYDPDLKPDDILVTSSGVTGEDVMLSPQARKSFPVVIECKNQEAINIWAAIKQAESHVGDRKDVTPVLFFKRNKSKLYAVMDAETAIKLLRT